MSLLPFYILIFVSSNLKFSMHVLSPFLLLWRLWWPITFLDPDNDQSKLFALWWQCLCVSEPTFQLLTVGAILTNHFISFLFAVYLWCKIVSSLVKALALSSALNTAISINPCARVLLGMLQGMFFLFGHMTCVFALRLKI